MSEYYLETREGTKLGPFSHEAAQGMMDSGVLAEGCRLVGPEEAGRQAGLPALLKSIDEGDHDGFFRLVNEGADVYERDANGHGARWHARQRQDQTILESLDLLESVHGKKILEEDDEKTVGHDPSSAPARTGEGVNCLEACVEPVKKFSVKTDEEYEEKQHLLQLLQLGDMDGVDDRGRTPLMIAIELGIISVAERLIECGADVNIKDEDGETALMYASKDGYIEVVKLLLEHGAVIDMKTEYGDTALMYASKDGYIEIVKLLLEHGADVNIKDEGGRTALMIASSNGHVEIVKLLLEHGAVIDMKNKDGWTALISASLCDHIEIVKLLLEHGADVNNEGGGTALMIASCNGYVELVKLLLEHGADVNRKTEGGKTALMIASDSRHVEVVKLLKSYVPNKKIW